MKKRVFIAAALAGVFYLQSSFAWAANPPQPDQENTKIHDQRQIAGAQSATEPNRTGDAAKPGAVNTDKEQGPAPVILRIRLVDKTAD